MASLLNSNIEIEIEQTRNTYNANIGEYKQLIGVGGEMVITIKYNGSKLPKQEIAEALELFAAGLRVE